MNAYDIFITIFSILENYILLSFLELFYKRKRFIDKCIYTLVLVFTCNFVNSSSQPISIVLPLFIIFSYSITSLKGDHYTTKLFLSIIDIGILFVSNAFIIIIMNLLNINIIHILNENNLTRMISIFLSKLLLICIYLSFKIKNVHFHMRKRQLILFYLSSASILPLYMIIFYLLIHYNIPIIICLISFILLIFIYYFFYLYIITICKSNDEIITKNTALKVLESDKEFAQKIIDVYTSNQKLQHDLNHHFITIKALAENQNYKQILNYLNDLEFNKNFIQAATTPRFVLNSLLNYHTQEMLKLNIDFRHQISDTLEFINDVDLAIILGNLITNATEAAKQLDDNKYISLRIFADKGRTFINIENSYKIEPVKNKTGILISIKDRHHGYGIENVEETVAKYNGELHLFYKDSVFNAVIVF